MLRRDRPHLVDLQCDIGLGPVQLDDEQRLI
jgi:hypothetical protein